LGQNNFEVEVLGCLMQAGLLRKKKLPTTITMQLFGVVFFNFLWAKKNLKKILEIFLLKMGKTLQ
jgi:hypothetical protein